MRITSLQNNIFVTVRSGISWGCDFEWGSWNPLPSLIDDDMFPEDSRWSNYLGLRVVIVGGSRIENKPSLL